MLYQDENHKTINLEMCSWPVAITGDGCSVKTAAEDDLATKIGLLSPNMICGSHAANGSLKRMTNSKTMNVGAVTNFFPCFGKIIKHFKLNGKNTTALNETLKGLGMKKVHVMLFCSKRMAYLLSACSQVVALLVPISNALILLDLKKETRDYFLLHNPCL